LTYDGETLQTSGAFVVGYTPGSTGSVPTGEQAKFGGWVNVQSNLEGSYPDAAYNSPNGVAGFSMGWNLSGGGGEAVIMNNYDLVGQGVHFRLRTGETGSNLLAAIGQSSPGQPMTGALYSKDVRITGCLNRSYFFFSYVLSSLDGTQTYSKLIFNLK